MEMIVTLTRRLSDRFSVFLQEERSRKVFINVMGSFMVKVVSMAVTLTLVPVSLRYTNPETYGVWLTLSSVITWFNLLDFGLSNGLTNKLASSFALGESDKARQYLSSTYAFLIGITIVCCIVFFPFSRVIDWTAVFNAKINSEELRMAVEITFVGFCLTFVLKPINELLKAKQKHFILSIIQVSGNIAALLCIVMFGDRFTSEFLFLCVALSLSYPLALLIASLWFFAKPYRDLTPRPAFVKKSSASDIGGISAKFFIIQISVIAILTSNNFLISYFVDNENVTTYNIALRLFSIISIFQVMIMTPLWPAFTDAYALKDFAWIRSTIMRSNWLNYLLCIPLLLMVVYASDLYRLWIGPEAVIPFDVNLLLAIFVAITLFKETYVSFINGSGRLNLQTLFSIVTIALQIPFAWLLSKHFGLGLQGILILNIFWVTVSLLLWRVQYQAIMSGSERKIWN